MQERHERLPLMTWFAELRRELQTKINKQINERRLSHVCRGLCFHHGRIAVQTLSHPALPPGDTEQAGAASRGLPS